MLIYSTNFDEKLLFYAQSREFIKYNSPFCDLIDNPLLKGNFDIAICFNKAINGNLSARECVSNTLMLCSGNFEPYTLMFYRDKMRNYPIFDSEISRINYTMSNINNLPAVYNGIDPNNSDFYDKLRAASLDCVNALCNPFTDVSNSVGKITQFFPAANSTSVFSYGPLKNALISVTNGVDLTVLNKIPLAFKDCALELSKLCSTAWGAIQGSYVDSADKPLFLLNALSNESLRAEDKVFRYTPDTQSYADISNAGTNVLGDLANLFGGCFKRYEYMQRYNPYDTYHNNRSASVEPITNYVNDSPFYTNRAGQTDSGGASRTNQNLSIDYKTANKSVYNGTTTITPVRTVYRGGAAGPGQSEYSVFGAWIDEAEKTVWTDPTYLTADDGSTRNGEVFIPPFKLITPSIAGVTNNPDIAGKCLASKQGEKTSFQKGYLLDWLQGYTTNTDLTTIDSTKFNHGIAINASHFNIAANGQVPSISPQDFRRLCKENKMFAYINGQLIQVIDLKGPGRLAVDFTPYAFYKVAGDKRAWASKTPIPFSNDWKEKIIIGVKDIGTLQVRFCIGNPSDIIAQLTLLQSATEGYNSDKPAEAAEPTTVPPNTVETNPLPVGPPTEAEDTLFVPNSNNQQAPFSE